jgi:nucleoside-diphosphate-sugar epimerase
MSEEKTQKKKTPVSLVTGSCGFMGTHMIQVLTAAGHKIRATDLEQAYEKDDLELGRFPSVLKENGVEFIPSDMTRPETLAPLVKGVDYIFHIASVFNYSASWDTLYRVNVEGARALYAEAVKQKGLKKFILWGAGGNYGAPREHRKPFTEDMAPLPSNDYLLSKWQQEYDLIELGLKKKIKYAIMRPTTVYGPRAVYGSGQMIMEAARMKTSAMPGNFDAHIPFVHVQDVCGAALYLAENSKVVNEIYNLNDDTIMTMVEFFQYVAEITGGKFIKLPPVPVAPLRTVLTAVASVMQVVAAKTGSKPALEKDSAAYFGLDYMYANDKLKKTGYAFKYPQAKEGIRETVEWYKAEGWL